MLGIQITKAIITIPSNDRELSITSGEAEIMGEEQTVTATDILACLQDATTHKVSDDRELVTVIPIAFHIDDAKDGVKNPIGMTGSMLKCQSRNWNGTKRKHYADHEHHETSRNRSRRLRLWKKLVTTMRLEPKNWIPK